ncbi:sulfotransferase [Rhodothalassium salexigens]|nr:hypothetical protein [Rhodothalassium salexigens DSM 2132]
MGHRLVAPGALSGVSVRCCGGMGKGEAVPACTQPPTHCADTGDGCAGRGRRAIVRAIVTHRRQGEGPLQLIFIAGTWGSGTTAMAAALAELGVPALGPHLHTNDPATPNAFELLPFRDLVLRYTDEATLTIKPDVVAPFARDLQAFAAEVAAGKHGAIVGARPRFLLKMPLAGLALPYLTYFFDLSVILMHRPLEEVEMTRQRRGWPELYGLAGGRVLVNKTVGALMAIKKPFLGVSYEALTQAPEASLAQVIDFCGLDDLSDNVTRAAGVIRRA